MAHVPEGIALETRIPVDMTNVSDVVFTFTFAAAYEPGEIEDVRLDIDDELQDRQAYRVTLNDARTGGTITLLNAMQTTVTPITLAAGQVLRIYRDTPAERMTSFGARGYATSAGAESLASHVMRILQELADRLETHAEIHIADEAIKPFALVGGDPIDYGDLRTAVRDEIRDSVDFNALGWDAPTRTLTFGTGDGRSVDIVLPEGVSPADMAAAIKAAVDPVVASVSNLQTSNTREHGTLLSEIADNQTRVNDLRDALDARLDDVEAVARDFQRVTYLGTPSAAPARYVEIDYTGAGIRNTWVDIPGATMPAATASNRIDVRVQDHDNTIDEGYNQSTIATYDTVGGTGVEFNNSGGERGDNNVYRIRRLSSTRQMQFRSDTSDTYRLTIRETEPDATPRVRIDGTTITRDGQGRLMSSATGGTSDHLPDFATLPATGGYSLGDVIAHADTTWALVAGGVDQHIHHGTVRSLGSGWYGDDTFAWRTDPDTGLRAFLLKSVIGSTAPSNLWIRFHRKREYGESELVRSSGADTTPDYAYVHAPGEPGFETGASIVGDPFDVSFYSDRAYHDEQAVEANANRWIQTDSTAPPAPAQASPVGTRFTELFPSLQLTAPTSMDRRATNATLLTLDGTTTSFDLDDDDKQHGEFHFSIDLTLVPVSDVNMSFRQGAANATAADRNRNISLIVFASDLREEDDWANDVAGNRDNGLTLVAQPVYSGNSTVGTYMIIVGHDDQNRALVYWWWDGAGGATGAQMNAELRCSFTPNDAPVATGGAGGISVEEDGTRLGTAGTVDTLNAAGGIRATRTGNEVELEGFSPDVLAVQRAGRSITAAQASAHAGFELQWSNLWQNNDQVTIPIAGVWTIVNWAFGRQIEVRGAPAGRRTVWLQGNGDRAIVNVTASGDCDLVTPTLRTGRVPMSGGAGTQNVTFSPRFAGTARPTVTANASTTAGQAAANITNVTATGFTVGRVTGSYNLDYIAMRA